jgi:uncharacterized membrane protein
MPRSRTGLTPGTLPVAAAGKLHPMVLADYALSITISLIVIFFVVFPVLAHGLIGMAVASALGERQQNQAFSRGEETETGR